MTTQKVVELLEITGYGRVDYRIDDNNICYVFDIATMPYIIHHSSFAYWFKTVNLKYTDIYNLLINSNFENNILLEEKMLKKETEKIIKNLQKTSEHN